MESLRLPLSTATALGRQGKKLTLSHNIQDSKNILPKFNGDDPIISNNEDDRITVRVITGDFLDNCNTKDYNSVSSNRSYNDYYNQNQRNIHICTIIYDLDDYYGSGLQWW